MKNQGNVHRRRIDVLLPWFKRLARAVEIERGRAKVLAMVETKFGLRAD